MRADIINYGTQPENPASEAAGDLSGGLCAGSMDLHPAPNVKRTFNEDGGRYNGIYR